MCLGVLRIRIDDSVISIQASSLELSEVLRELAETIDSSRIRVLELSFVCCGGAS